MKTVSECVKEINAELGKFAECYDAYKMIDELYNFDESSGGFIKKIEQPDFWRVARESTIIGRIAVEAWDGPACYGVNYTNCETFDNEDDSIYCESIDDLSFFLLMTYRRADEYGFPYAVTVC